MRSLFSRLLIHRTTPSRTRVTLTDANMHFPMPAHLSASQQSAPRHSATERAFTDGNVMIW